MRLNTFVSTTRMVACFQQVAICLFVVALVDAHAEGLEAGLGTPAVFVSNAGQWPPAIRYQTRTGGLTVSFRCDSVEFTNGADSIFLVLRQDRDCNIAPEQRVITQFNYLLGNDPRRWRTGVPGYSAVLYRDIAPAVDARFYFAGSDIEYDLVVREPRALEEYPLPLIGVRRSRNVDGGIEIENGSLSLMQHTPLAYQWINGIKKPIAIRQSFRDSVFRFHAESYDAGKPLILDPTISYSSAYAHGNITNNTATGIAVTPTGEAVVAGWTEASFEYRTDDIVLLKLAADGKSFLFETLLGGSSFDQALAFTLDSDGAIYITGVTLSEDFPLKYAIHGAALGDYEAFVMKVSADGKGILFSTLLGGSGREYSKAISVDASKRIYVAGNTDSADLPVTAGAYGQSPSSCTDGFAAKIGLNGTSANLIYMTYLASLGCENVMDAAVDTRGALVIAGSTDSNDFPTTKTAMDRLNDGTDGFLSRLSPDGKRLEYSSFIGGTKHDVIDSIAIGPGGAIVLTGSTVSPDFPIFKPFQRKLRGKQNDAFVMKLYPINKFVFSTFIGGSGSDIGRAIEIGKDGNIYFAGITLSDDFPVKSPIHRFSSGGFDIFLAILDPPGNVLKFSTFWGGEGDDNPFDLATDKTGAVYIAGRTTSYAFPLKNNVPEVTGYSQMFFVKVQY